MRKARVSSHPGSRTCGAITWCRPMLFMSTSARPTELPTALLFRRRAARASACWSSTATIARPRRTPGNQCPDSFPRRSVSARYVIDTDGQPERAIRAAHRFGGTHVEPGAGRNLAGFGDISELSRRAGRTGVEAEACDVRQAPFTAQSRCRCRSRYTLATMVARPPNCSKPAATLPPARSGSRASTGGPRRAGQPPSGREQPRHPDGTAP